MGTLLHVAQLLLFVAGMHPGSINPEDLTCEYMANPSVVDVRQPRLSWINRSVDSTRGHYQTAWQVRVATSEPGLESPDMWNSGKVSSRNNSRITYLGDELKSRQVYWWQVRTWDEHNEPSHWSTPSSWRMGLLDPEEWVAQWIGAPWEGEDHIPRPGFSDTITDFGPPAPLLRKTFTIEKPIASAVAYVTGLGYFELYANGRKAGDDVLVPNQTNYGKRPELNDAYINVQDNFTRYKVMYLAYDLSEHLKPGENVLGGILGNGFYNPAKFWTEGYGTPRFLVQLHIIYEDGSEDVIKSDESWKVSRSPIVKNMVYYGETYDARLEQPGWNSPEFDDSSWAAAVRKEAPHGELAAHSFFTDKITERIQPLSIEKLGDGHYYVDFGVEISGWVRFTNIEGPEGHAVDISFNGNLYSGDNRYIFSGKGPASYAPRFNWFVFSGIDITNWPGELKASQITAEAVNTYIEEASHFETSNPLFNEINRIWRRSQTDNMHGGIASDCPHRERSGYTGDGQVACATVMHNFDARNFYQKWIQDIKEAQDRDTGYVPNGAPWQPGCGGGVAWGAAICIMPWEFYLQYGAVDMLEDNYESMKGYIGYMTNWVDEDGIMHSQRRNGSGEILKWFNLGDWVPPGELVPDPLVHTFYYWMCADYTARSAAVLGNKTDALKYSNLATQTRKAFHRRFYSSETGSYGTGGGDVFALHMGVPDSVYDRVRTSLAQNVSKHDGHLDTGIFGTRYFFEVLAENNLNHLAYEAMNKRTEPGFGRWIELGSTTTREHWDESGSFNHPMFGGGLVWFYRNLAGMRVDDQQPGYKHIIFKPQPVDELRHVTYSRKTEYGHASISWIKNDSGFKMDITVPVGSTATVYFPSEKHEGILEGNKLAENAYGVTYKGLEEGYSTYEVVSGHYRFTNQP